MSRAPHRVPNAATRWPAPWRRGRFAVVLGVLLLAQTDSCAVGRKNARTVSVAAPKPVRLDTAHAVIFRPERRYAATIDPWLEATIGPQLASARVHSVVVGGGAIVHRGDVVATLDCAERTPPHPSRTPLRYATANDAFDDCVLRAPFDGEIVASRAQPGATIRPGEAVASEIDRSTLRIRADVPAEDFTLVAPGTPARIRLPTASAEIATTITRRSPVPDRERHVVDVEIDVPDPSRRLIVHSAAEIVVDLAPPTPAIEIPRRAASVRNGTATVFVVEDGLARARRVRVVGDANGLLYVDPTALRDGAMVVTSGRATLSDGDRVVPRGDEMPVVPTSPATLGESR